MLFTVKITKVHNLKKKKKMSSEETQEYTLDRFPVQGGHTQLSRTHSHQRAI